MKNRNLLSTLFILIVSTLMFTEPVSASPVDTLTARKAAVNFYNWKTGRSVSESIVQLSYRQFLENGNGETPEEACAFYVFNIGDHYVMVSADTRVLPVLGYSTESTFHPDNIPAPIQDWMNSYAEEIQVIVQELTDEECEPMIAEWDRLLSGEIFLQEAALSSVTPLLNTTWNQNYPYNTMCPVDASGPQGHAYAGCVACALAQIIRYWEYPTTGIGSHTYNSDFTAMGYGNYGVLSANFGATTYDYSLMPNSLNGATQAQINEVAKLMYHCGVAVDMMYGPGGSGAYDSHAATALKTYFGYNSATLKYKSSYTDATWLALVKDELNNLRPVYYSGQGSGGHAFVCDGYDDQDYLHFNWGWGGNYNGYYAVTSLTPGTHNYSSSNMAVVGVDAASPMIHTGTRQLSFFTEQNIVSASKSVNVLANHISGGISASVTGNFKVSTNNSTFSTSLTMGNNGGTLYVRYHPAQNTGIEHGYVVLSSGNVKDTIMLTGVVYNATPYCLPPENLTVSSQNLQDVSVQWETPVVPADPQTLTWAANSVSMNYGSSADYKRSMLQRYCDTDLIDCHNKALTQISFYLKSGVTLCKALVYKGGHYDGGIDPGTLVLSQNLDMNSLSVNSWNTVTLSTPVMVDATQELWFGIYIEAPGGSYCMPMSSHPMPTKGAIVGTHSGNSISWGELTTDYSVCVKGTVKNVQTVTDYAVYRNGTLVTTTAGTSYQDHLSSTNTYQYTVTANWSNGCSASASKSFTNVAQITATPEVLDFYTNHGYGTFVKSVVVTGSGLSSAIQAVASGSFQISTNGSTYSSSLSMPISGGTLYVKYAPSSTSSEFESGLVTLTSGSLSATVALSGQQTDVCYPPQNLLLSQTANAVDLSWNAPAAQAVQQYPLTWYGGSGSMNYGSNNYAMQYYLVHRFSTDDLSPYHGKLLKSVSFIASSDATAYKIVVYKGGSAQSSYLTSGTQVVDQTVNVSSLTPGSWNTIALNTPVTIDAGQELWYGIYMEAPAGTYPIPMGVPYVAKKGLVYKTLTTADNRWREYLTANYCFSLNATIEDAPLTLTHYQIDRNETVLGQTTANAYSDNILYNGEYDYDVWAVWNNGCKAPARGSITVTGLCDPAGQSYTQEACESYTWNDTTYYESGVYTYNYSIGECPAVDTLHLTINNAPESVVISGNLAICNGDASTTLYANVIPNVPATFTWYKDNIPLSGTMGDNLVVTSEGSYKVVASVNGCATESAAVAVTVDDGPQLQLAATESEICVGGTTVITAAANGWNNADVNYSWNNGYQGSAYSFNATTAGTETFIVTATHITSGCVATGSINITVNSVPAKPVVGVVNETVCNGGQVTLQVTNPVAGAVYTWYRNGVVIPSATQATLYESPLAVDGDATNYVYNVVAALPMSGCISESSDNAIVYVIPAPVATVSVDGNTTFCQGGNTTLNVNVTPAAAYTYQWYKDNVIIANATNADFVVNEVARETAYNFKVVVTANAGCSVTAAAPAITVVADPVVSATISNDIACVGGTTTLTAVVEGGIDGISYTYQWYRNTPNSTAQIVATGATHITDGSETSDNYTYWVVIENGYNCNALSSTVNFSVVDVPAVAIAVAPGYPQNVCEGGASMLKANVIGGYGGASYQWYKNGTVLAGETNQNLALNNLAYGANDTYTVEVTQTGVGCSGNASAAINDLVAVNPAYTVDVTGSGNVCEGGTLTLTATVNNVVAGDILSYQWYKIMNGQVYPINGVTSSTYSTSAFLLGNSYEYFVVVNSSISGCSTVSSTVPANVVPAPSVAIQGANTVCEGGNLTLNAFVNGGVYGAAYTYTWNWTGAATGTAVTADPTFVPTFVANDAATPYYVTVTISRTDITGCTATSAAHEVNVLAVPTVSVTADNAYVCQNGDVTLTAHVSPVGSYNYVWTINGQQQAVNAATVTTSMATTGAINASVVVSAAGASASCSATASLAVPVQVVAAPTVTIAADYTSLCVGGTTTLTANVNANGNIPGDFSYQWAINGIEVDGAVANTFVQPLNAAGVYTYTLRVSQNNNLGCNSAWSAPVTVQVAEQPVVTLSSLDGLNICEGGSVTLNAVVTNYGTTVNGVLNSNVYGAMTFDWTRNGVNVHQDANVNTGIKQFTETLNTIGSYNYQVTVDAAGQNCLPQVSNVENVGVINNPMITIAGEEFVCYGQSTILTASGADGYIWATGSVIIGYNASISVSPEATTNYSVTGTNQYGCSAATEVMVIVKDLNYSDLYEVACESYTWNNTTYTESGEYIQTFTNAVGCDSTVTLHLTINHGTHNVVTETACESFTWHSTTYTTSGTYEYHYTNTSNCPSVDTLHLTINHGTHNVVTETACESFTWHGQTYTTSGTYTYSYTNGLGCQSADTLHLTVNYGTHNVVTETVCESYTWHGQTYTTSGTYTYSYINGLGCQSADTLHLTVNYGTHNVVTETACESYIWHGTTYTQTGTYEYEYTNSFGCQSVDTLKLTINNPVHLSFTVTAYDSYTWTAGNGQTYTTSGTYTYSHADANNCTQVDTLHLTVYYSSATEITEVACESYEWDGVTYTESGYYPRHYTDIHGADSLVTLLLTINQPTSGDTMAVACESFTWYGTTYTASGNYTTHKTNAAGCDSTVTLHLTINQPTSGDTTAVACENFTWYGTTYTTSGNYTTLKTNVAGCDSTLTLHLTINQPTTGDTMAVACENFTWYGTTYTASGDYTIHKTNVAGCDSTVTLHLTINQPTSGDTTAVACESFTWYGTTYTTSGDYTTHKTNVAGCDSTVTLHLTINQPTSGDTTAVACESFTWYGATYTASGEYTTLKTNAVGCDSTVTLHLTINQPTVGDTTAVACESFTWYGTTYTASGDYTTHKTNAAGCDSTLTLHLTINQPTVGDTTAVACENFTWYGTTYTTSGNYTIHKTNAAGCDSTVTLHLTINQPTTGDTTAVACESFTWYGATYTTSGNYTTHKTNVAGCDSTVTLHLTINHPTSGDTTAVACESFTWYGTTYTASGDYTTHKTNVAGCDSTVTLHLTINPVFNTPITAAICDGGSYDFFGQTLTTAGTYTHTLQSISGCDSVITLTLTVNPIFNTPISAAICDGSNYDVFGQTLTTAGTYTYTLQSISGCDSIITLTLTVNDVFNTPISAAICDGSSYDFFGQTLTTAGTYTHTLQSISGCDSIITLTLTVNPVFNTPISAAICDGSSYDFFGQTLTTAGIYTHMLQSISGCDSIITLTLTVNPVFNTPIAAAICDGSSYDFFGQTLTTAGTYTHSLQSVSGCDSIITLTLTVNSADVTEFTETACEEYVWNNETFTVSGDYTRTFTNVAGCDSTVTLHLTVNYGTHNVETETACESFTWHGETYNQSGTYTYAYTNGNGCASVDTLHLTINYSATTDFSISTADSCYEWNMVSYCETGDYTQTLQTVDGCDSVVTLHLTITVGIGDHDLSGIDVFPNPTNGILNIKGDDIHQILIYNADGQLVYASDEWSANLKTMDVSSYAAGQYFVKIIFGNKQTVTKKVIVNRK